MWKITFALGHTQAWLAAGYRQGTPLEKVLILPSWCVFRSLFITAYWWQLQRYAR